jgi:hypothetical protein
MKFLKLLILCLVMIGVTGCATTFQPPASCEDGADSFILKVTGDNPTGLDRALLIAQIVALEKVETYNAVKAQEFLEDVRELVNNGVSYLSLLDYLNVGIADLNKAVGLSVIIMGADVPAIAALGGDLPLGACDKELILMELLKQEQIVALYK